MEKVKVSKKFADDFAVTAKFYECTPDEIAEMKQCARENLDEAIPCFAAMAKEIS